MADYFAGTLASLTLSGYGLTATLTIGFFTWLCSLYLRDVSIVDRIWSLLIAAAASVYFFAAPLHTGRAAVALGLLWLWALRLTVHITRRNWGHPEDARYQSIRKRNQPHFAVKSLYLIFATQAVIAWLVALPLFATAHDSNSGWCWSDTLGATLALVGIVFEAVADWQLDRFKSRADSHGRVMDQGLWGWSRHPNYFGEACIWWGLFLMSLAAGGWWSIISPLCMTVLLLKVSGVHLLEKDIAQRRPQYQDYGERVNAFIPGPQRRRQQQQDKA